MIKYLRYLLSGYFYERRKILRNLNAPNVFIPSQKKYELPRIVVYTVSTGGYDKLKEPLVIEDEFDYFVFTNEELSSKSVWKKKSFRSEHAFLNPIEKSRAVKILPHLYFDDYDISIYIDGNISIIRDLRPLIYTMIEQNKTIALHRHSARDCVYHEARVIWAQGRAKLKDIIKQIRNYKRQGFPNHYGLFENNIIIRFHNDDICKKIMECWWNEFVKFDTKRDQLSFTYSLWKNGLGCDYVMSLGNCSRNSEYFSVVKHSY